MIISIRYFILLIYLCLKITLMGCGPNGREKKELESSQVFSDLHLLHTALTIEGEASSFAIPKGECDWTWLVKAGTGLPSNYLSQVRKGVEGI